jgi:DNA-directed RNA polymerase specialized sigma subunit
MAAEPTNKRAYINNKNLLIEVHASKAQGKLSNKLAQMFQTLCANYATKGCWVNYTYNEDMQAYAMLMLVKTWNGFKPEKSNNPFAFYTQCIKNSFRQYLNVEKKQRTVRDLLLVDQGLTPSYGFQEENGSDQHFVDDEQDFYFYEQGAKELQQQFAQEDPIVDDLLINDQDDTTQDDSTDDSTDTADDYSPELIM